jgi:hypothetical protein
MSEDADDWGLDAHLRAGVAVYNAGHYHASHDAWEAWWLDLPDGDDERFLHGLIQFTAAVHHAHDRNWAGATGLAGSAQGYLDPLPDDYHGVNLAAVRGWLAALERDPESIERAPPLPLELDGVALLPEELEFPAAAIAAPMLAPDEETEALLERAADYGRADIEAGKTGSPFVSFLLAFLEGDDRPVVLQRLREHVERRGHRESDVEGLFD